MKDYRSAERCQGIEISGIRKLFEAAGPDSINMGLGQPDFDTPDHIKEAAIRAIREGKTGYTSNMGIPELREAISEKFQKENGLSYPPDRIIVTAGASEALHIVMHAPVLSPTAPSPSWPAGGRKVFRSTTPCASMSRRPRNRWTGRVCSF